MLLYNQAAKLSGYDYSIISTRISLLILVGIAGKTVLGLEDADDTGLEPKNDGIGDEATLRRRQRLDIFAVMGLVSFNTDG